MSRSLGVPAVSVVAAAAMVWGCSIGPAPLSAQLPDRIRTGLVVEDYSVDAGLDFESIRQLSVPVVAEWSWAGRGHLTVASGWTEVRLGLPGSVERVVSGPLDAEARLRWALVRDRLDLMVTGSLPTGTNRLDEPDLLLVGLLANDLFGFSTPSLGSGGSLGVGLGGAGGVGAASLGWAVHGRLPFSYQPVAGSDDRVRAGSEIRLRVGLQSPLGRRTSVSAALVASLRNRDELNERPVNRVGHRVAGYVSVDVPVSRTVLNLWGSGVVRSDPAFEPSVVGAAFIPRGHFWSAGGRWVLGVGSRLRIEPQVEYRSATAATDASGLELESLGGLWKAGARVRRGWGRDSWLVLDGTGAFGSIRNDAADVDTRGMRIALYVEWTR
ncbi:MAG: hypothetical protein KJO11_17220 [Gemmatimonadetes bacterium]|nr:hypothetical protein [Gemmatimonadota bacterium]